MFQRTLKFIESWKDDGAQKERRGQAERDARERGKWEMEVPGGSGGKSMRACGNGGATSSGSALNSSVAYLSLQMLVPTSYHDCISSLHVSKLS